jgi:protein phosphatase
VLHLAHVGDSRCYGWRRGELQQLTDDHSVENEARLRRARGEVVYYHEASRNALTRCIGQPTPPSVDLIERPLRAGDRYLFCTDGVTRIINNAELNTLIAQPGDPEKMLRDLVTLALKRGAPDNVTAVLLMIDSIE